MREIKTLLFKMAVLAAISVVLALGVNAVSPRGVPWLPLTHETDFPPERLEELEAEDTEYITLDMVSQASQFGLAVVIDARTPKEFADGHIPNAVNVPVRDFRKGFPPQLKALNSDDILLVYCEDPDCGSSGIVAEQLRLCGKFTPDNVRVFTGGFPEWQERGMEVAYEE